jgi:hypothetical protein
MDTPETNERPRIGSTWYDKGTPGIHHFVSGVGTTKIETETEWNTNSRTWCYDIADFKARFLTVQEEDMTQYDIKRREAFFDDDELQTS